MKSLVFLFFLCGSLISRESLCSNKKANKKLKKAVHMFVDSEDFSELTRAGKLVIDYKAFEKMPIHKKKEISNRIKKKRQDVKHKLTIKDYKKTLGALKAGADKNLVIDKHGNTALHSAVIRRSLGAVYALVSQGADLSLRNKEERTALYEASYRGESEIVELLLSFGASRKGAVKKGRTTYWKAFSRMCLSFSNVVKEKSGPESSEQYLSGKKDYFRQNVESVSILLGWHYKTAVQREKVKQKYITMFSKIKVGKK